MFKFLTSERCGYSIQFSSLLPGHLAVATSQYFGLSGGGTLFILRLNSEGSIEVIQTCDWQDGLFNVAWSVFNPYNLITGSGDGVIQLWDLNLKHAPIEVYSEHHAQISSISWSKINNHFISSSWDSNIKLWDLNKKQSVSTFSELFDKVHAATFSKCRPDLFSSVYEDGMLIIWDTTISNGAIKCKVHDAPVLSCDWNSSNEFLIATSGSDGFIRGWDIRNCSQPRFQMKDSNQPTKKIQFSPDYPNILASAGFDFSTKIWDIGDTRKPLEVVINHTDFVFGLDWNLRRPGQLADCGWDKMVSVFTPNSLKNLKPKM